MREETCLVNHATETVMNLCHGKRQCTLSADVSTFGNPCHYQSRLYLKAVYTCVPRNVLQEKYDSRTEEDETVQVDGSQGRFELEEGSFPEGDIYSESPNMAVAGRRLNTSNVYVPSTSSPPLQRPASEDVFRDENKFIVYLIVCVSASMLSLVLILTVKRFCCHPPRPITTEKNYSEESQAETSIDLTTTSVMPIYAPVEHMPQYVPEREPVFHISNARTNHYYYG
uniref:Uncharacterized protein n=1 Tax=Clastoptera arizonana TaxID=38151 RepID=A0A1B6C8S4_9HEMI